MTTLTHDTCQYIGTGPRCTAHTLEGKAYCEQHYALVYKVGSGRQRRKDTAQAQRVRYIQQLMQDAIDQLEAEGFDLYGERDLVDGRLDMGGGV